MARYFSDAGGEAVELVGIHQVENAEFSRRWPGVRGIRCDGYTKWAGRPAAGADDLLTVTRMIDYKRFPSRHECNARCLGGKATGTCECSCGGKNHGRGMFTGMLKLG